MSNSSTAYNLSAWLAKNDVSIDRELIDTNVNQVVSATLKSSTADKEKTAAAMLGSEVSIAADTYTGTNGTVAFSKDSFTMTAAANLFKSETAGIDRYNAGKRAEQIAKQLGFDLSGSVISSESDNDVYTVTITKTIDGRSVFDDAIVMTLCENGLMSVNGVWYTVYGGRNESRNAKSCIDTLVEFLGAVRGGDKVTITAMSLGYNMKQSGNITEISPVWRIETDNGEVFYLDA